MSGINCVKIHPAANLFPLMTESEYVALRDDIRENGLTFGVVFRGDELVDGRNRLRAIEELGLDLKSHSVVIPVEQISDPIQYVLSLNLHRRHLTESQRGMIAADVAKLKRGDNQHSSIDLSSSQSEAAVMLNVSVPTVKRAKQVKENAVPEIIEAVERGEVTVSAAAAVAKLPEAEQRKIASDGPKAVQKAASAERQAKSRKPDQDKSVEAIVLAECAALAGVSEDVFTKGESVLKSEHDDIKVMMMSGGSCADIESAFDALTAATAAASTRRPHVTHNSGNSEWCTPPEIIESARTAMRSIDCDPASSADANATVKAHEYFTADDDGLKQTWFGNVWLNPPYAQPLISRFANAVATKFGTGEIDQACVLVNNATETEWFSTLASNASAICFPTSRLKFLTPDGVSSKNTPLQGQAIVYLGGSADEFIREFSAKGIVVKVVSGAESEVA